MTRLPEKPVRDVLKEGVKDARWNPKAVGAIIEMAEAEIRRIGELAFKEAQARGKQTVQPEDVARATGSKEGSGGHDVGDGGNPSLVRANQILAQHCARLAEQVRKMGGKPRPYPRFLDKGEGGKK